MLVVVVSVVVTVVSPPFGSGVIVRVTTSLSFLRKPYLSKVVVSVVVIVVVPPFMLVEVVVVTDFLTFVPSACSVC